MIYLGAKQLGSGVSASGGRFVKGAFIAEMRGGTAHVFKRQGTARLPIDKQEAEIEQTSDRFIQHDALGAEFEAQFFKVFEHELKWQTR
jgi:hypothetical protein